MIDVREDIARLAEMTNHDLRNSWRKQYRGEPPNFTYREGQCYVIQPNVVTADGMRGVQFGEMVHITADGVERLHAAPRQLFVV